MNKSEFLKQLNVLNDAEKFYKTAFEISLIESRKDTDITNFEFVDILKNNPDILNNLPPKIDFFPIEISETHHKFPREHDEIIALSIHNRYTPSFTHKHTFFEIIIVVNGMCTHKIAGKTSTLKAGDIVFIPFGTYHSISVFNDDTVVLNLMIRKRFYERLWLSLSFEKNFVSKFFSLHLAQKNSDHYIIINDADEEIIEIAINLYNEFIKEHCAIKSPLCEVLTVLFLTKIIEKCENLNTIYHLSNKEQNLSMLFMDYMEDNISNISLEKMAKHFNYTPTYLSKKISDVTGCNYSDMVQLLRFAKAKKLLDDNILSITDISKKLGFSDRVTLYKLFKKMCNMTPNEYRNQRNKR